MSDYRVRWEIDIDADNPEEAAERALAIQRDNSLDNSATVFDVGKIGASGLPVGFKRIDVFGAARNDNNAVPLVSIQSEINNALLVAGQLAGLATQLNDVALEKFLDNLEPDSDFRYEYLCRTAIKFCRDMSSMPLQRNRKERRWNKWHSRKVGQGSCGDREERRPTLPGIDPGIQAS